MTNGVYRIKTNTGEFGKMGIAIKDGMGIACRPTSMGNWGVAGNWTKMTADQIATLAGYGLDANQTVIESPGRTLKF